MTPPSSALKRALDRSADAERRARIAPMLDVVKSNTEADATHVDTVAAGTPPAGVGGAALPKTSSGPAPSLSAPMQRSRVALELIDIAADRLRSRDDAWEEVIATTYGQVGQLQAVRLVREPTGRFILDGFGFGVSRISAARLAGWAEIDAEWCDRALVDQRFYRLPEIIENIARRKLSALDEARFLAEYKAIHLRLYPATGRGGDRRSKRNADQSEMFSFRSVAAEQTGLTTRSIEIKVAIWTGLAHAVRDALAGTSLADNQAALRQIAPLEPGLQGKVVALLTSSPAGAATVADAIVLAQGKRLMPAADKRFKSVAGGLTRLSAEARKPLWTNYADEIIPVLKAEGLI